jgi:DnaJ-class molecular chaperone
MATIDDVMDKIDDAMGKIDEVDDKVSALQFQSVGICGPCGGTGTIGQGQSVCPSCSGDGERNIGKLKQP